MKLHKPTVFMNLAIIVMSIILINGSLAGIGTIMLLLAPLNLIISLGFFIAKKPSIGVTLLLCAGLLILVGFSVCSAAPSNLNVH